MTNRRHISTWPLQVVVIIVRFFPSCNCGTEREASEHASHRVWPITKRVCLTSVTGQNRKNSNRAYVFPCSPKNGRWPVQQTSNRAANRPDRCERYMAGALSLPPAPTPPPAPRFNRGLPNCDAPCIDQRRTAASSPMPGARRSVFEV
jgi:hypothetical protein